MHEDQHVPPHAASGAAARLRDPLRVRVGHAAVVGTRRREALGQYYNWTIDELLYAAKVGFDGVCTNEHHQNAYGFMPSPNMMGSVLAKLTNGTNVAIVQMGATLPTSNPPIRVAEEYAMLDCIRGGRPAR